MTPDEQRQHLLNHAARHVHETRRALVASKGVALLPEPVVREINRALAQAQRAQALLHQLGADENPAG